MIILYTFLGFLGLTFLFYLFIKLFYNVVDKKESTISMILWLLLIVEIVIVFPIFSMVFDGDGVFTISFSRIGYMLCGGMVLIVELTFLSFLHSISTLTRKV